MLQAAINHKFDMLICYRLDRISRNITDFTYLVDLLNRNNIGFISIRENFDTSTPMGRAMMFIASVFSQLERETISERIRDNMYSLAKMGRWLGGKTPMGFTSQQIEYYDSTNNKKKMYRLYENQEELEVVKLLYDKYLELSSLSGLQTWTLKSDIKTRNKKAFDKSGLRFILSNPVYAIADKAMHDYFSFYNSQIASSKASFDGIQGLMVYNRHDEKKNRTIKKDESEWIVAVGLHRGILPSQLWIRVQSLLHENGKRGPRTGTGKFGLLTNLLNCKNCGSKMRVTVYRRSSGVYYYYKCLKKEKSKGTECNIANLNGKITDKLVMKEISRIDFEKFNIDRHLRDVTRNLKAMCNNPKSEKVKLQSLILNCETSINNLTLQLGKNQNTNAANYIVKQIEEFDREVSRLRAKLKSFDENKEIDLSLKEISDRILSLINNFNNNIDKLDFQEKKGLIKILIDKITWDGSTLVINVFEKL